jgi:hypothetical protein
MIGIGLLLGLYFSIYAYEKLEISQNILILFNILFILILYAMSRIKVSYNIYNVTAFTIFYGVWFGIWYYNLRIQCYIYTEIVIFSLCPAVLCYICVVGVLYYCKYINEIHILSNDYLSALKDISYRHTCHICLNILEHKIKTVALPCGHIYHKECILGLNNKICIFCNKSISADMGLFKED